VRSTRQRYLDAIGIDVYVNRSRAGACGTIQDAGEPVPAAVAPGRPVLPSGADWQELEAMVRGCARCELHATRTQTVFGTGSENAGWMFIGEAPGAEEDRQGEPFVGRAGQLLNAMLKAAGLSREEVYIANILKCRPPGNRDPRPEEAGACRGYLERQIELVDPAVIVAVGRIAAQNLLQTDAPLARLRGQLHSLGESGRPVIVTYHPAYLLRTPADKRKAWSDLLLAREAYERRSAAPRRPG
jgi:DNA polymerase